MVRSLIALFLFAGLCLANVRLYLKDGTYHIVSEYKVLPDRVRYYSVERGDWEEIPVDLVDLKKTESSIKEREQADREQARKEDVEEKAERAMRAESEKIPGQTGVYMVEGNDVKTIKQAETKVKDDKRRNILKAVSPIPMVSGKSEVQIDGEQSANVVTKDQPEFYIRLNSQERFGIARLIPGKGLRIVDKVDIMPVTKEYGEKIDMVDVFRHQVDDGLYKIWPVKPLTPGEYAVIEYTDGTVNVQVWDFAYRLAAK
jgi:hypothetical protein